MDHDEEVLHLLRHNHPYQINRLVVLADHPDSPMAMAVNHKRLELIKDFDQLAQTAGGTIARHFTRNYQSNSCIIAPPHEQP